jgi:hypothetical protein
LKSIEHHPQQALVSMGFALGRNDAHQALVDEIAEQDAHHPDGQVDLRGEVDNGLGLVTKL